MGADLAGKPSPVAEAGEYRQPEKGLEVVSNGAEQGFALNRYKKRILVL
jgi:hypothetical protein